ncbi:mce related family protein, partial [Vibrio parahaemolyticus V-223/04]
PYLVALSLLTPRTMANQWKKIPSSAYIKI